MGAFLNIKQKDYYLTKARIISFLPLIINGRGQKRNNKNNNNDDNNNNNYNDNNNNNDNSKEARVLNVNYNKLFINTEYI